MLKSGLSRGCRCALVSGLFAAAAPLGLAEQVSWTDWAWGQVGQPGWVDGLAHNDDGDIQISYTGEVRFFQTDTGGDYWAVNDAYLSDIVENAPTGPDIIALTGGVGLTQTLTFSKPVTNPLMAIVSLGNSGGDAALEFDAPIEIVSQGRGIFGEGTLTRTGASTLVGREGHGVIQFIGTFTEISWTAPNFEYWHGFTIGLLPAGADCRADFNDDGSTNTVDVLAFLNAWNAQDTSADMNGDGAVNTQDVLLYLNLWTAGC